jgi:hypothetical protein
VCAAVKKSDGALAQEAVKVQCNQHRAGARRTEDHAHRIRLTEKRSRQIGAS